MKNEFHIETNRLVLRKLERKDLPAVFCYRSQKNVSEFQSFMPTSLKDMETFYLDIASAPNIPNTWFQLAILLREENILIGDIGIHFLENNNQVEIGYTLDPHYQRQGYAYEAVSSVITYLFLHFKKDIILASVDKDNVRSIHLLTKLGFKQRMHISGESLNDKYSDDDIFVLNNEYRKD